MLKATFVKKQEIAKDTWQFIFKKPKDFSFKAGQYTTVFLDNDNRDFTVSANPEDPIYFSIVTKVGTSDFKKKLFSLQPNVKVTMKEPSGGFLLEESVHPKVLLAGGIGMNPFYSMITYVQSKKIKVPITLLVSFSKKEHMIFYEELMEIASKNSSIKVVYSLSQEAWAGDSGRISKDHILKHIPNFKTVKYMIAGGEAMVEDTEKLLLDMGIPQENIRIDIFTGY